MTPDVLQQDLSNFHAWGVTAVNAEASNNWAARGLGYYVASQLLWDVDADTQPMVKDFYEKAFGPAAPAMERYFVRWYGPSAAALGDDADLPQRAKYMDKGKHDIEVLRAAYADLDDAITLTRSASEASTLARSASKGSDSEAILARIDHLRMYMHYLLLRYQLQQAEATGDKNKILAAIGEETQFGGRLTYTNMIHTRPLLGKAFLRRFRKHAELLENHPAAQQKTGDWRVIGTPPQRDELDRLWEADKTLLGRE